MRAPNDLVRMWRVSKRVNVSSRGDDEGNRPRWALMAPARSIPIDSRANGAGLPKTRKRGKMANVAAELCGRAIW